MVILSWLKALHALQQRLRVAGRVVLDNLLRKAIIDGINGLRQRRAGVRFDLLYLYRAKNEIQAQQQ